MYRLLAGRENVPPTLYHGLEWNKEAVKLAHEKGLDVTHCDLNNGIPHADNSFGCVFGLSVLEHLLRPCQFIGECFRVLEKGGRLVILTPNISTYFTAALILAGRMPSSGPHPDSNALLQHEEIFKVSSRNIVYDAELDMPAHRHLVVFSYKSLKSYLQLAGFKDIEGYGYGLYPFPNFLQPALEKIDPYHCHQMVFVAKK